MYQTLVYQCIAFVFFTQPVTAKEVTISSITIMTFRYKRIIVVPRLACFQKMTQKDQEKAAFYLEDKYHYVWITTEFVVLILQKCSELSWMKVVLKCSQRTYRYFNQMAIKVQFRLKVINSVLELQLSHILNNFGLLMNKSYTVNSKTIQHLMNPEEPEKHVFQST